MSKVVTHLKVHSNDLFIPGVGSLGNTLPSSSKTLRLAMRTGHEGVYVTIAHGAVPVETIIPWNNIVIARVGEDYVEPKKESKK